ncbi:MAG: O-methyltransferase [Actinomycetia bacterium]|nr:O-methyltransferase [Actinomycetes bacterium]
MERYLANNPDLARYAVAHSSPVSEVGRRVMEQTAALFPDVSQMQVDPIQGAFLAWLVRLVGARRVLEIGTFTGLSSLFMAAALPEGGEIVCCDISEEYTALARQAWREEGVADRVTLLLGPALDILTDLAGPFDMAFLDADKPNYPLYLEKLKQLVRPGGVIVADNTLWSGRVIDPEDHTDATEGIRRLNEMVSTSADFEAVMLPFADGVTVILRS